eukprot:1605727-Prorocentrum_lima.AAC.1
MLKWLGTARGAFAFTSDELGCFNGGTMRVPLDTDTPLFRRQHRLSQAELDFVAEQCKELEDAGIIRQSSSSYAAAVVVAPKKDAITGAWTGMRMATDLRLLNAHTPVDRYPMPRVDDVLDKISPHVKFVSSLDLRSGFHQIAVAPEDQRKLAFWGGGNLYEWVRMPFGHRNASAVFQRAMDKVLAGLPFAACYIDD